MPGQRRRTLSQQSWSSPASASPRATAGTTPPTHPTSPTCPGDAWVADSVNDPNQQLVPSTEIVLTFTEETLSVDAGCNSMHGPASIEEDELVVDTLASTRKACDQALMDQDDWVSALLTSRPTIELLNDELSLTRDDTVLPLVRENKLEPSAQFANWLRADVAGSGGRAVAGDRGRHDSRVVPDSPDERGTAVPEEVDAAEVQPRHSGAEAGDIDDRVAIVVEDREPNP